MKTLPFTTTDWLPTQIVSTGERLCDAELSGESVVTDTAEMYMDWQPPQQVLICYTPYIIYGHLLTSNRWRAGSLGAALHQ